MTEKHDDNLATPERLKRDKLIREALEKDPGELVPMFATASPKAATEASATKRMSAERLAEVRKIFASVEANPLTKEQRHQFGVGHRIIGDCLDHIESLTSDLEAARGALEQSVKFQSHYAAILNDWDGGKRMVFANADAWMDRLRALKDQKP